MKLPIFHAENLAGNPTCIKADEIAAVVEQPKEGKVIIGTRNGREYGFSAKVIKEYYSSIFQDNLMGCEATDLSEMVFAIVEHLLNNCLKITTR